MPAMARLPLLAIEDMLAPRWDAHFQNYRPKMDCVHWCNRPSVWEPVLMQLQRATEARSAADDYLANPDAARRVDVLRTTAKLAFADGSCPEALPYLAALADTDAAQADDLVPLARCLGRADPGKALQLLDRAEGMQPSPKLLESITTTREAIHAAR